MKKGIVALVGLSVFLIMCTGHIEIESEKVAVKALLEESISATEDEDMDRLAATFAQDDDLLFVDLPTDKDTKGWPDLKAMFERQFEKYSDVDFKQTGLTINVSKDRQLAWCVYFCDFTAKMGDLPVDQSGARITYVFEKRDGKWLIVHFHYSVGRKQ